MRATVRRFVLPLHRWAGLTVGLLVTWMAVTGAGLTFRAELGQVVDRELNQVARCAAAMPLDAQLDAARAAHPDETVSFIWLERGGATKVRFTDRHTVYVDPCTAELTGERHQYRGPFGWLEYLHRFRFMEGGNRIAGSSALIFAFVIIVGGIVLWWPASLAGFKRALKPVPNLTGVARALNLHRTVGGWVCLIVLVSALTGPIISFPWYRDALLALMGAAHVKPAYQSVVPGDARRLSLESLWERARQAVPAATEAVVTYPRSPASAVEILVLDRDAPHGEAWTRIHLDAYSGALLGFSPHADSGVANKVLSRALAIHKGRSGVIAQMLLLLGAVAVPFLAWTGINSYLRRRRVA